MKLIHGDCLEKMKDISDGSVDMVLCDPPYGTTVCKWDSVIPFDPMWEQLKRVVKHKGAICLFGREPFSSMLRMSSLDMFRYDWVWEKSKATNFLFAKQMPLICHETISVFYKQKPLYIPQKSKGKPYNKGVEKRTEIEAVGKIGNGNLLSNESGERNPRSIVYFRTAESEGKFHPTQKPVALLEYIIKTYTLGGETVLDFTMGSGSTGVACVNLNRHFIGIEKDSKYFEIAKNRINNHLTNDEADANARLI